MSWYFGIHSDAPLKSFASKSNSSGLRKIIYQPILPRGDLLPSCDRDISIAIFSSRLICRLAESLTGVASTKVTGIEYKARFFSICESLFSLFISVLEVNAMPECSYSSSITNEHFSRKHHRFKSSNATIHFKG